MTIWLWFAVAVYMVIAAAVALGELDNWYIKNSHANRPPLIQQCLVQDDEYGICTLARGHSGNSAIHQEWVDGQLWAEWRSVFRNPDRAKRYLRPDQRRMSDDSIDLARRLTSEETVKLWEMLDLDGMPDGALFKQ